jgi:hypothetical protein
MVPDRQFADTPQSIDAELHTVSCLGTHRSPFGFTTVYRKCHARSKISPPPGTGDAGRSQQTIFVLIGFILY